MSNVGIGAGGVIGIAQEVTVGTYVAPTKFFPVRSENLSVSQTTHKRRVIRGTADALGQKRVSQEVGGDIVMEALHDVLPYFLYAGRWSILKSGAGPYTYAATPSDVACLSDGETLSITVVRNGVVFGYTGCVVSSMELSIDDEGIMASSFSIIGLDEAVQSAPTASWPSIEPFGNTEYTVEIDDGAVTDFDSWSFSVDNSGEAQYRIDGNLTAQYIKFGERTSTLSVSRDFINRTDYDAFKALTAQKLELTASDATHSIYAEIPVAYKQSYEVGLSSQGDLIMGQIEYEGVYDATVGGSATLTVITTEDI